MRARWMGAAAAAVCLALALGGCGGQASPDADEGPAAPAAQAAGAQDAGGDGDDGGASLEGDAATGAEVDGDIDATLARLSLEQKVAQLFIVSSDTLVALPGAGGDPFAIHPVGGVLFTGRALEDPDQTSAMLAAARAQSRQAVGTVPLLCVDEEGGLVARVANNPQFGVRNVGDAHDLPSAEEAGAAAAEIASYLAELGFNVDFAPVCDLADDPQDVMYERSFGADPQAVAAAVRAQVEAFSAAGIACSLKHFPGIGGTDGDSHEGLIRSDLTLDQIREGALVPFEAGIAAGAPLVMVGHLSTPGVTGDNRPASLQATWMRDVLRDELGFEGVVITDALEMGAVGDVDQHDLGAAALIAGADLLLCPTDFNAMYEGVLDAVAAGELSEARIDESARRVLQLKAALS